MAGADEATLRAASPVGQLLAPCRACRSRGYQTPLSSRWRDLLPFLSALVFVMPGRSDDWLRSKPVDVSPERTHDDQGLAARADGDPRVAPKCAHGYETVAVVYVASREFR